MHANDVSMSYSIRMHRGRRIEVTDLKLCQREYNFHHVPVHKKNVVFIFRISTRVNVFITTLAHLQFSLHMVRPFNGSLWYNFNRQKMVFVFRVSTRVDLSITTLAHIKFTLYTNPCVTRVTAS